MSISAFPLALVLSASILAFSGEAQAFGTEPSITGPSDNGLGPNVAVPGNNDIIQGDTPEDNPDEPPVIEPAPPRASPALLPDVHYDLSALPPKVADMRGRIVAAAMAGDMQAMRQVIGLSNPPPAFSALDDGDPIDILKAGSGDGEGLETLAILLDVLDAGWVVKDPGTSRERYIWPYFSEFPPDSLTKHQLVEVYRVLTAGDFEDMKAVGAYEFYRVEIAADGRWLLFMSGE
ncbi:hypothetical protein [Oryzibacter oryziterrae]|uniref:hypothetical protein n=1 Tax=Oryzibacter oryziterrae TaxID=2766474 RepID=UPI001F1A9EE1|nr:hypothetical protein [Oryzibacter oryziterrae]